MTTIIDTGKGYGLPMFGNPQTSEFYEYTSKVTNLLDNLVTISHGLGRLPTRWKICLRCIDDDVGYSPGDEIDSSTDHSTADRGFVVGVNANEAFILMGSYLSLLNKSTFNYNNCAVNKWEWVVRLWVDKTGDIVTSLDTMGVVPLHSGKANNESGLDIALYPHFNKGYKHFQIRIYDYYQHTLNQDTYMRFSFDNGVSFDTTSNAYRSNYNHINPITANYARCQSSSADNNTSHKNTGIIDIPNPTVTGTKQVQGSISYLASSGSCYQNSFGATHVSNDTSIDAIRLLAQSGNVTGKWSLYGYKEAV